jgi:hypothetical protein
MGAPLAPVAASDGPLAVPEQAAMPPRNATAAAAAATA